MPAWYIHVYWSKRYEFLKISPPPLKKLQGNGGVSPSPTNEFEPTNLELCIVYHEYYSVWQLVARIWGISQQILFSIVFYIKYIRKLKKLLLLGSRLFLLLKKKLFRRKELINMTKNFSKWNMTFCWGPEIFMIRVF